MTTPNLQLSEFGGIGIPSGTELSNTMRRLDAVVQVAADAFVSVPPSVPSLGDRVIVSAPEAGTFAGHDLHIAYKTQLGWEFIVPEHGWLAIVGSPPVLYVFDSSIPGWVIYEPPSLQTLSIVRIVGAYFSRGGAVLTAPANSAQIQVPFSGTLVKVTLTGESSSAGSAQVDILKSPTYPAGSSDSILGASPLPAIAAGFLYENEALSGWDREVTDGDWVSISLETVSVFTGLFVQLHIRVSL